MEQNRASIYPLSVLGMFKWFGWGTAAIFLLAVVLLPLLFAPIILFWSPAQIQVQHQQYYQLGGAVRFAKEINYAAAKHNLDPALIAGIIKQESGFDPNVVNPISKAAGLMQLMPFNYEGIDPFNPAQNIDRGSKILREYLDMFNGDLELGLAAYNAGPGNVKKYGGIPSFPETQNYVPAVMKHYKYFQKYTVPIFSGSGELGNPAPEAVMGSKYGPRNGEIHTGQDFPGKIGTPILAAEDGKVVKAQNCKPGCGYGFYIVIDHGGGVETLYAHMWEHQSKVKKGQRVKRGQQIGEIGNNGRSSGPHLHFEVRVDGHPVDPRPYLKAKN